MDAQESGRQRAAAERTAREWLRRHSPTSTTSRSLGGASARLRSRRRASAAREAAMSADLGFFVRWSRRKVQQREYQGDAGASVVRRQRPLWFRWPQRPPRPWMPRPSQHPPKRRRRWRRPFTPASGLHPLRRPRRCPGGEECGAEAKLFAGSAVQPDGRPRHLYRRLRQARTRCSEGMLRQLAQSQFLGPFDDDEKERRDRASAPTWKPHPMKTLICDRNRIDAADAAEPGASEPGAGEDAAGER